MLTTENEITLERVATVEQMDLFAPQSLFIGQGYE